MKQRDYYSSLFSSARISAILPALTHSIGVGGSAVWTGMLESIRIPETAQDQWFCPSVGYLGLFEHAAGFFPTGMITSGRFLPSRLQELADLVSQGKSLVIGPLEAGTLTGQAVPTLWSGAPMFVEMIGIEEPHNAVLRIFGAHSICSVNCCCLAPPQHHYISWLAASRICKSNVNSILIRMRSSHEPCIKYLTHLSGDCAMLADRIKRQGLSSVERYCLNSGLRMLQECLWDAYCFMGAFQVAALTSLEDRLVDATARLWICLQSIAQGYSIASSTEGDITKYIGDLSRIMDETPILSFTPNRNVLYEHQ